MPKPRDDQEPEGKEGLNTRIDLFPPDGAPAQSISLSPDQAILVGREPSGGGGVAAVGQRAVREVAVGSPSVSSNHLLVWRDGQAVHLRDLASRNGTWLRLPPQETVQVPAEVPVTLRLAALPAATQAPEQPPDAQWEDASGFARAVAGAVDEWLRDVGEDVEVRIVQGQGEVEDSNRLALGEQEMMVLSPRRTTDARWGQLLERIFRYAERQRRTLEAEEAAQREGLVMCSAAARAAHRQVLEAAERGLRLVLMGPSGSGKEGLARAYHRQSGRAGAFVAINCAMLSGERLRTELFGAERGSFTSSVARIVGAVERARGGTLFLDEVAQMSQDVQPMLLRFLDNGEYERMGNYGRYERSDVRIICATNEDLREAAAKGQFRRDLWYRLAGQVIRLAPLRERFDDVLAYLRVGQPGDGLSPAEMLAAESLEVLRQYHWEGNFRELANFVLRLPRGPAGSIGAADCRRLLDEGSLSASPSAPPMPPPGQGEERLFTEAATAFAEDHQHRVKSWDDQKELLEQYLKPLLFARMTGADQMADLPSGEKEIRTLATRLAARVAADRGTAQKQLLRYIERFRSRGA